MAESTMRNVGAISIPSELSWTGNMSENWRFFRQKFDIFLLASGNKEKESKIRTALLLSCVGDRALKVFNTFGLDEKDKNDIEKVLKKFEEHFYPDRNVTYERYKFFTRNQKPNETYEDYIVELRDLSASCEFGLLTESLIKDKLVCGIQDIAVKDRLLRAKNLTLSIATEICRTSQETKLQMEEICSTSSGFSGDKENGSQIDKLNLKFNRKPSWNHRQSDEPASSSRMVGSTSGTSNMKRQTKRQTQNVNKIFSCTKCGYNHEKNQCPAFNKRCLRCNKYNHYASQCNNTFIHEVQEQSDEEVNALFLGAVFVNSLNKTMKDWSITVGVNNNPVQLKVDTGAQANVLVSSQLPLLGLDKNNLLPRGVWSLKNLSISVPRAVLSGDGQAAILRCSYDLEGAALYSIRWYRAETEFYRYVPREMPPSMVFPLPGASVDLAESDERQVRIVNLNRRLSGLYQCEVSADLPLFHTDIRSAPLTVVDPPFRAPMLHVSRGTYSRGDVIRANCSVDEAYPAPNITWILDEHKIAESVSWQTSEQDFKERGAFSQIEITVLEVEHYKVGLTYTSASLSRNYDNYVYDREADRENRDVLRYTMSPPPSGQLSLGCVATIYDIYARKSEIAHVREDAPRPASVTGEDSAGASSLVCGVLTVLLCAGAHLLSL